MSPDFDISAVVGPLLARTPEWIRQDLASKEPLARLRAEESLAMMIGAALREDAASHSAPPHIPDGAAEADLVD